uniref:DNA-directed RNA polymerase RBP11-like dimerisation domain-containing protein n=1 Tax=Bos indicus x Bos taurus TaxID=30522 RepID=A0A4W2E7G3_BOBOX
MTTPSAFMGKKKITVNKDFKVPKACLFTTNKENHTLGNISQSQLLKAPQVQFAGYKVRRPLQHKTIIHVQSALDCTPRRLPPVPSQTSPRNSPCWRSESEWPSKFSKEKMSGGLHLALF